MKIGTKVKLINLENRLKDVGAGNSTEIFDFSSLTEKEFEVRSFEGYNNGVKRFRISGGEVSAIKFPEQKEKIHEFLFPETCLKLVKK